MVRRYGDGVFRCVILGIGKLVMLILGTVQLVYWATLAGAAIRIIFW